MIGSYSKKAVVTALFRGLWNVEPNQQQLKSNVQALLSDKKTLSGMVREFYESKFATHRLVTAAAAGFDHLPPPNIAWDLPTEERRLLWSKLAQQWRHLGETDAFWSVLSSEEYRAENMGDAEVVDRFYASGKHDITRMMAVLERAGVPAKWEMTVADYGCGLGRQSYWFAQCFRQVRALDVSSSHLKEAQRQLAERNIDNVSFHQVAGEDDLAILNGIDLFHSVIVLQHSPPPIIASVLRAAFAGLNPGGVAYFQVPTSGFDYQWTPETAFAQKGFDMHMLPQAVIFRLAAEAGCVPLEVLPDSATGIPHWISNSFLFHKPA